MYLDWVNKMDRSRIYDGIPPNLTTSERVAEIRRRERAYDEAHKRPVANPCSSMGMIGLYKKRLSESKAAKAIGEESGVKMGWFTRFSFWIDPFLLLLFTPMFWLTENTKKTAIPVKKQVIYDDDDGEDDFTNAYSRDDGDNSDDWD